jgi:hypothetical protein
MRKMFLWINRGKVGLPKHYCRRILFIGLTMTTCFGRAWPSSGHKLSYKLQGENVCLYMKDTCLGTAGIHLNQRDLVVNSFFIHVTSGAKPPKMNKS